MNKFNQFADKYLVPIANKVGTQRHIQAIKDGILGQKLMVMH